MRAPRAGRRREGGPGRGVGGWGGARAGRGARAGGDPVVLDAGAVGVLLGRRLGQLAQRGDPVVELLVVEDAEAVLAAAVVAVGNRVHVEGLYGLGLAVR